MRKRLKKKKRSCPLCKPHKMKWTNRWKTKEFARIRDFEEKKNAIIFRITPRYYG